ncbi:Hypothetical_protein [Hexamita inflata]|uniref:Hypothetical_protein n=1 Tax=Hexamita inflata TaxID=28002 RepID=A0AA86Q3P9_9EUKA|nr:Hypothetical protein HINF_LOCUS33475 [Hexamita inflata]
MLVIYQQVVLQQIDSPSGRSLFAVNDAVNDKVAFVTILLQIHGQTLEETFGDAQAHLHAQHSKRQLLKYSGGHAAMYQLHFNSSENIAEKFGVVYNQQIININFNFQQQFHTVIHKAPFSAGKRTNHADSAGLSKRPAGKSHSCSCRRLQVASRQYLSCKNHQVCTYCFSLFIYIFRQII